MLAFEPSRQQHFPASHFGLEAVLYPGLPAYESMDSSFHSIPFSYYENQSLFVDAPQDMFRSASNNTLYNQSTRSELAPSSLSSVSASAPSVPSANSSTVGSPYSGHAHALSYQRESWGGSNQGLGLHPTIVNTEAFNDFVGADLDPELTFATHEKLSGDFVGESANLSSSSSHVSNASSIVSSKHLQPPYPHELVLSTSPESVTIDTILEQANSVVATPGLVTSEATARSFSSSPITPAEPKRSLSSTSKDGFKSPSTPASAMPKTPKSTPRRQNSFVSSPLHQAGTQIKSEPCQYQRSPPASPSTSAGQTFAQGSHFQNHFFAQSSGNFVPPLESSYPQLIQPARQQYVENPLAFAHHAMYTQHPGDFHGMSPAPSPTPSHHEPQMQMYSGAYTPPMQYQNFEAQALHREASTTSFHSSQSHSSPMSGSAELDEEGREKGRCPNPECGRVFKDLKAHMLTHQSERPEKCPILNCEYNQKGFARKYDKNRHTLTHYKGTMVCGFCPGSGSAAEKSFNRADVFKRHLTSLHGVEQTAPNSRKKSPSAGSSRKITSYCQDATGKCSTCSNTFSNAQDFYEHLDDCVLRVVQQEEPSEAINQQLLSEVARDSDVKETLDRNMVAAVDENIATNDDEEEEDDEDDDEDDDPSWNTRNGKLRAKAPGARVVISGAIQKQSRSTKKGFTFSKGGVPLLGKGRKKRKHYPPAWGAPVDKMKMKKRVLCVYDGERRLWKDDMMLDNEFEVRMKLADGNSYVTDLDIETMKRAEAIHGATKEERGPWIQDSSFDLEELMS